MDRIIDSWPLVAVFIAFILTLNVIGLLHEIAEWYEARARLANAQAARQERETEQIFG